MQNIFFIHGALGDASQVTEFALEFNQKYRIHIINLPGHGRDNAQNITFSMQAMVDAVVEKAAAKTLEKITVFGYSMGGYIGMCIAKQKPHLIDAIITIGTKYEWSPTIASAQLGFFNTDKLEAKQPAFTSHLSKIHGDNWKQVVEKTGQMIQRLGSQPLLQPDDYNAITCPCLLLLGDRDRMVSLEETIQTFQRLPKGALGILPDTAHPFEQVNKLVLSTVMNRFLDANF